MVHFYFENPTVFQYKRGEKMTPIDFLSQVKQTISRIKRMKSEKIIIKSILFRSAASWASVWESGERRGWRIK